MTNKARKEECVIKKVDVARQDNMVDVRHSLMYTTVNETQNGKQ